MSAPVGRHLDCCIPKWRNLPCLCGTSDKTLGECCALDARQARDLLDEHPELRDLATPPPPAKVGRNDPCPCSSGRKFKKCCAGKVAA